MNRLIGETEGRMTRGLVYIGSARCMDGQNSVNILTRRLGHLLGVIMISIIIIREFEIEISRSPNLEISVFLVISKSRSRSEQSRDFEIENSWFFTYFPSFFVIFFGFWCDSLNLYEYFPNFRNFSQTSYQIQIKYF